MKAVAVVTDNAILKSRFSALLDEKALPATFTFWSYSNKMLQTFSDIRKINLKEDWSPLLNSDIIISLHCKQIFPAGLVRQRRCINVHPGLNPYNRGWYPQVFSIINKMPVGATIHEIDNELDHGAIIAQQEVKVYSWDTSQTVYNRILDAEIDLLNQYIAAVIDESYDSSPPKFEGNLNLKEDFRSLCQINLDENSTYRAVIDRLRALTHGDFANAFYIDEDGKKIFVKISLSVQD